jgi:hypothetical protein
VSVIRPSSRCPSSFHDDAYRRDAGHDQMQAEFLGFLRARQVTLFPESATIHREVEGELPIKRRGQIVAYADACEILHVDLTRIVSIFEIKPKIHTVFGIFRQCKAMLALANECMSADQFWVFAVVPHTDPLIDSLRVEWPHVWAWGATFHEPELTILDEP